MRLRERERGLAQSRQWYSDNAEKHNDRTGKRNRARRATIPGRAANLLTGAKQRAGAKGEPFTLTLTHVVTGLERGVCPRTGFWFDLTVGKRKQNPYAPSLDKINPTKPYSDDNVQVVCWQYNAMKQELSDEELLYFCKMITERA